MTKQQTVELLQKQLPGFYSVDQVIKMINDIEEDGQSQTYNESQIQDLIDNIDEAIERRIQRLDSDDLVDKDSAEFELCGNEISLYRIQTNDSLIADECVECVRNVLTDFFELQKEAV